MRPPDGRNYLGRQGLVRNGDAVSENAQDKAVRDPTVMETADAVRIAQQAIRQVLHERPDHPWRPSELMAAARETVDPPVSNTMFSIAFWDLVESEEFEVDDQMVVRPCAHASA